MSRMDGPTRITVRPQANIYTALAFISMLATLAALVDVFLQWKTLIGG